MVHRASSCGCLLYIIPLTSPSPHLIPYSLTHPASRFLAASPTAELEPCSSSYTQTDEVDMGMTYAELQVFGMLRTVKKCGPFSMVTRLAMEWGGRLSVQEVRLFAFFTHYDYLNICSSRTLRSKLDGDKSHVLLPLLRNQPP